MLAATTREGHQVKAQAAPPAGEAPFHKGIFRVQVMCLRIGLGSGFTLPRTFYFQGQSLLFSRSFILKHYRTEPSATGLHIRRCEGGEVFSCAFSIKTHGPCFYGGPFFFS